MHACWIDIDMHCLCLLTHIVFVGHWVQEEISYLLPPTRIAIGPTRLGLVGGPPMQMQMYITYICKLKRLPIDSMSGVLVQLGCRSFALGPSGESLHVTIAIEHDR